MENRIHFLKNLAIALLWVIALSWVLLFGAVRENNKLSDELLAFQMEAVRQHYGRFVSVNKYENKFEWKK